MPEDQVGHIVFGTVIQEVKTSNIGREVSLMLTFGASFKNNFSVFRLHYWQASHRKFHVIQLPW